MSIHEPTEAALRAATAPGHAEELAGEDAAVAAFRAAAPVPRRRLTRVLTVRTLVIGVAAASTGVVLVGVAGLLPFLPSSQEPATVPPTVPTVVTNKGSEPALPLPDRSSTTADVPGTSATPPPSSTPPAGEQPEHGKQDNDQGREHDRDEKDKKNPRSPGGPGGSTGRNQTPGSSAQGAVTAVPPSGAKPPSQGG